MLLRSVGVRGLCSPHYLRHKIIRMHSYLFRLGLLMWRQCRKGGGACTDLHLHSVWSQSKQSCYWLQCQLLLSDVFFHQHCSKSHWFLFDIFSQRLSAEQRVQRMGEGALPGGNVRHLLLALGPQLCGEEPWCYPGLFKEQHWPTHAADSGQWLWMYSSIFYI